MKKTLSNILNRAVEITTEAKSLGFINIRICDHRDEGEDFLHLIVSVDTDNPAANSQNDFLLQYVLTKLLGCVVIVMVDNKIKDLYKEILLKSSADLHDRGRVCSLFQVDLSTIFFDEPRSQDDTMLERTGILVQETKDKLQKVLEKQETERKVENILTSLDNIAIRRQVVEILKTHPEVVNEMYRVVCVGQDNIKVTVR